MLQCLLVCAALLAIQYPAAPEPPQVTEPKVEGSARPGGRGKAQRAEKVALVAVRVKLHLGDKSALVAETQIPAVYSFTHKKGSIQYYQAIKAEDIRELAVESYRSRKVATNQDGEVYEFEPATVRIELKDGQVFKLGYLFKELRMLKAKNADGAFSVFAYFADTWKNSTWLERPTAPEKARDGQSLVTRTAHPAAYTRLEYFEPVEKTPATGEAGQR